MNTLIHSGYVPFDAVIYEFLSKYDSHSNFAADAASLNEQLIVNEQQLPKDSQQQFPKGDKGW